MSTVNESNLLNQKIVFDITRFTTTDFADHLSCVVWFAKCNMRCLYCYNDNIVNTKEGHYSIQDLLDFLGRRRGLLEAVVLSGGEATLHNLEFLCKKIKALNYKIKLDTNGLNPTLIKELIKKNLIDYVSLDYKAPKEKFNAITQCDSYERFEKSLKALIASEIAFEVRTTVHNDLLSSSDINLMIKHLEELNYQNSYYIQHFLETESNLGNLVQSSKLFDKDKIHSNRLNIIYRNEISLS